MRDTMLIMHAVVAVSNLIRIAMRHSKFQTHPSLTMCRYLYKVYKASPCPKMDKVDHVGNDCFRCMFMQGHMPAGEHAAALQEQSRGWQCAARLQQHAEDPSQKGALSHLQCCDSAWSETPPTAPDALLVTQAVSKICLVQGQCRLDLASVLW